MGGGCGPYCTTFTLNVPLSTLSEEELESIRESIIALLQGLGAGKVTVSFREGSTKAYASTKNPVNEETLNGKVTEAGDIQTLGDSRFIIAQINGKATEYNNKLIIVPTDDNELIKYIDDVGVEDEVARNDWISKGITDNQIKHVAFGKNVKTIGNRAFRLTSLTEVTIGNSVTTIGESAFAYCRGLTEVNIPDLVETIGPNAYVICSSLTEINVDAGNTNYSSDDGVLFNNDITELIQYPIGNTRNTYTIPNSVETIGDNAFYECTSLTEVTIPNSVETIGDFAFSECTALAVVKWDTTNVTTIPPATFYNCSAVSDPTNFRVNNAMLDTFGFGANNGDFSDLSVGGGGLEFGALDSGGAGFKTVKVA